MVISHSPSFVIPFILNFLGWLLLKFNARTDTLPALYSSVPVLKFLYHVVDRDMKTTSISLKPKLPCVLVVPLCISEVKGGIVWVTFWRMRGFYYFIVLHRNMLDQHAWCCWFCRARYVTLSSSTGNFFLLHYLTLFEICNLYSDTWPWRDGDYGLHEESSLGNSSKFQFCLYGYIFFPTCIFQSILSQCLPWYNSIMHL